MRITFLLSARSVIDIIGTAEIEARGARAAIARRNREKKGKKKKEGKKRLKKKKGKKREERSSERATQVCSNCECSVRATLEYSNSNYSADDPRNRCVS